MKTVKMKLIEEIAQENMKTRFVDNPNRGFVIGFGSNADIQMVSWIMGRSEPSQNRVYAISEDEHRSPTLKTEEHVKSGQDMSNRLYTVMAEHKDLHVVSNGIQTDQGIIKAVYEPGIIRHGNIFDVLQGWQCENDYPIFTPRITGYFDISSARKVFEAYGTTEAFFSVIAPEPEAKAKWKTIQDQWVEPGKRPNESELNKIESITGLNHKKFPSNHSFYQRALPLGFGYCVTTYKPGSKDLDAFEGEPFLVPMGQTIEDTMQAFWNTLDERWRVSVGGKTIDMMHESKIAKPINKHLM
jgi:hypothetical protein